MKKSILHHLLVAMIGSTFAVIATACGSKSTTSGTFSEENSLLTYANHLQLYEEDDATLCIITDINHPDKRLASYLLLPKGTDNYPSSWKNIEECIVIRTPLDRIALTSTCHAYLLQAIGGERHISVLCDAQYTQNKTIKQLCKEGHISDGGASHSPNWEQIYAASIDAFWTTDASPQVRHRLSVQNIPLIMSMDYLESSPLGRAEWMRFYGRLCGKGNTADSLFAEVEKQYKALCHSLDAERTQASGEEPTQKGNRPRIWPRLLADSPYGGTWFVAGGNSYISKIYQDAGAEYIWSNDHHVGSIALSPEAVLAQASDCDLWILKRYAPEGMSLQQFFKENHLYSQFKAAVHGNIYWCNSAINAYYDETPFHPDWLLEDIHTIVHHIALQQELLPTLRYFQRLE